MDDHQEIEEKDVLLVSSDNFHVGTFFEVIQNKNYSFKHKVYCKKSQ